MKPILFLLTAFVALSSCRKNSNLFEKSLSDEKTAAVELKAPAKPLTGGGYEIGFNDNPPPTFGLRTGTSYSGPVLLLPPPGVGFQDITFQTRLKFQFHPQGNNSLFYIAVVPQIVVDPSIDRLAFFSQDPTTIEHIFNTSNNGMGGGFNFPDLSFSVKVSATFYSSDGSPNQTRYYNLSVVFNINNGLQNVDWVP